MGIRKSILVNHLMQKKLFLADLNAKTLAIGAQKMVAVSMARS
jgi:hypothetical protein